MSFTSLAVEKNTKMEATALFEGCPLSFSFVWRIKNFENAEISSLEYILDEERMQFSFSPPGETPEFTLKLRVKNQKQVWNTLVFIPDNGSEPHCVQEGSVAGFDDNICHGIWKTESNAFLKEKNEFVANEYLTFFIILRNVSLLNRLGKGFMRHQSTQTSFEDDMTHLNNLSQELSKLLESGSYSDVVLTSGGKTFPAHKGVLSARSEVFDETFRIEKNESEKGEVIIEGVDSSDFQQFLRYLYSGKVDDLSEESAKSIYVVADKYKVEFLKKKCSTFLVENLSGECALRMLALADKYGDSTFTSLAMKFIVERDDILIGEDWDAFVKDHPMLALQVYKEHHNRLLERRREKI